MIRRCCFFLALLLTCSASEKDPIDWNRCDKEMECYLLDQCITIGSTLEIIETYQEPQGTQKFPDPNCKLGIQKRTISDQITLYFVRVKATLQAAKISFYHGDKAIVHCQQEADGTISAVVEDATQGVEAKPYEDLSYFKTGEALCAFTVNKMGQLATKLVSSYAKTSVQFSETLNGETVAAKHEFRLKGVTLYEYRSAYRRCNPSWIRDEEPKEYSVIKLTDKLRMSLDCKHHKAEKGLSYNYQLYVQNTDDASTPEIWPELKCELEDGDYYYTDGIRQDDGDGNQVLKNPNHKFKDDFIAFCGVEMNKVCDDPKVTGNLAPTFTPASDSANPKLTCNGGKWLIGGKYYKNIEAECRAWKTEVEKKVEKKFMFKLDDYEEKEWIKDKDKCFEKYNCFDHSELDIPNRCEDDSKEDSLCVKVSNKAIQCGNEVDELHVRHESDVRNTTQKFKCNEDSGLFVSADGPTTETIPIGARLFCLGDHAKPSNTGISEGALIAVCAGGVALLTLLAVGVIFCVFNCVTQPTHFKAAVVNRREIWNRMSSKRQFTEAQKVFKLASNIDPETNILDGLKLLDTILATETEDPAIWELIDTFLYRLHLTTLTYDVPTGLLLNRYCYLQAKKIINKHGWNTPKPITRKQPEGVIRAHAVRLLALARRTDLDAQKMVLEGFKQLAWRFEGQYPHCGLLWSVVAQQRVGDVKFPLDFLKELSIILEKPDIPLEDRIPQFGSIMEQTYFALYAADVALIDRTGQKYYQRLIKGTINKKEGAIIDHEENLKKGAKDSISEQELNRLKEEFIGLQRAKLEGRLRSVIFNSMNVFNGDVLCGWNGDASNLKLLEHMITTLVFRRMFKEAKRIETQFYQERAMFATGIPRKDWFPKKNWEDEEADENLTDEQKEKREIIRKIDEAKKEGSKVERQMSVKAKTDHELYVEAFMEEAESIHSWLTHKVKKAEARVASDNNKTQPNTQPNSTSLAAKSSQSTASAAQKPPQETDFVDDFVDSYYKESPKRITTCQLSVEEQNKYRALLPLLMNEKKAYNSRYRMSPQLLIEILDKATDIFETEPVFIEDVPAGITVVGDTHGQLYDLVRVFEEHAKDGKPGYETARYLFLGDYVDRGPQILEVVMTLFILKILYPDRFILLRGNHEFISQNYAHDTMKDVEFRFNAHAADIVYQKLNETFAYMPICAVIGGEIFCAHGGISGSIMTRNELRILRKPIYFESDDLMLTDILWSDPHRNVDGIAYNFKRRQGIYYGEEHALNSLERLECTAMIRAHEIMNKGYAIVWPSCCLTIFGATAVDVKMNNAAFVRVSEDLRYEIVVLQHDKLREDVAAKVHGKKGAEEVSRCDDYSPGGAKKPVDGCAIGTGEVQDGDDD